MKKIINKILNKGGYQISKHRSKADQVFETQKSLLNANRPNIIFDVGAYDGDTSLKYNQSLNGNCEIYSFEPFEESYKILETKIAKFKNIKAFNIALGNRDGDLEFNVNKFAATNSFLDSSPKGIEVWGGGILETQQKIQVPTLTIDSFMKEHEIPQIDVLKMDTQGAEYLVMEGAKDTIKSGKINIIFSELIVLPTYENQKQLDEMLALYRSFGFELFALFNSNDPTGRLKFLDGIFIYKN